MSRGARNDLVGPHSTDVSRRLQCILRSLLAAGLLSMAPTAGAQDKAEVAHGKPLVESNCARCHAIGPADKSAHPTAPEFRTLIRLYRIAGGGAGREDFDGPSGYAGIRGVAGTDRRDHHIYREPQRPVSGSAANSPLLGGLSRIKAMARLRIHSRYECGA